MNAVMRFDVRTSMKLQRHKNPAVDKVLLGITKSANGGMIWIMTGLVLLAVPGYREAGIFYFEVLAATAVVNNLILKSAFMRKRPCDLFKKIPVLIKRPHGSSFPSGHTAISFACAAALCAICLPAGIFALCLATIIGFTRIYFFVHFFTDVLFGVLSGLTTAAVCVFIFLA